MNDDDLFAALRRADPARDLRDDRSELQIQEELARITATPTRRVPGRRAWRWPLIALPAAAAAVVAVVIGVQVWQPAAPAIAVTPPLLEVTPTTLTTDEVLERAIAQLEALPDAEPERGSSSEGWYHRTEVGEESSTTVIQPQEIELTWREDLSGDYTVTVGDPYIVVGGIPQPPQDPDGPQAGSVIVDERFGPGEAPVVLLDAPPSDPGELRDYLTPTLGAPPANAGDVVLATRHLLSEWKLGPHQHAAVLSLLLEHSAQIEVVGDVTDRLGRAGTALRVSSPSFPNSEMLLIVSRETGKVIALENIYLGGIAELDLEAPSVVEYVAWK